MPAGITPAVTVTVTNTLGLSTSASFGLAGGTPCEAPAAARVAAGYHHTLALKTDGTVWAWGNNTDGQLGDGTNTPRSTPVQVQGLTGVVAIAANDFDTLALKADGTVWAWGNNSYGQLGDGTAPNDRSTPVQVQGLTGVVAIAA
ncbi:RCC1 domain-containing protein, partial [Pyxidicoccus sp. 3LFB2]